MSTPMQRHIARDHETAGYDPECGDCVSLVGDWPPVAENPIADLIDNPDPFPPTPWRVERASGTLCPIWYVYDANDALVAGGFGNEEAARLCAAAPDLREAAKWLLESPDLGLDSLEEDTVAAINYAEGIVDGLAVPS